MLSVDRIDHGVKAVDDPALVADLAASGTPLTTCPVSNHRLRVYGDEYPAKLGALLANGLTVTINSDDPAYFLRPGADPPAGAYIADNYEYAAQVGGLGLDAVAELARRSFRSAFVPEEEKARLLEGVESALAAARAPQGADAAE